MPTIKRGAIVKGKVTGIQPYGAFVQLEGGMQGLIHISEISHRFVKDVRDYVNVGDDVTVKVLDVDWKMKRASLSLKALEPGAEKRQARIKMPLEPGFRPLKEKLREWIEQSKKEDLPKQ
ncbi:S1 domain-containing post-transcriptional regulator GSP13 [Anoxybacillus geothermalis]|uniref:S1 domain-containing post-transcriptional regulator GSP13 n=1 Tax=Geobacillus TaxID=129337 RepID=UPI0005063197|nr:MULTISPECIES: S1 domain-containing post-transcriptional regulator GSP13 [Geobacillus]AKU26185.1 general stress protein [Geobacillus sp. LC300]ASS86948.1 general stress protein [Geobacillus lituanicus]MED0654387.1 S1 domain-containing post-transcriptional regulator GSP13 [Anoxybacillus geothermalis]STO13489.1 General stress protein 13 [[Flavobacterium] thermophilum]KFL15526.1 general stress protein [Geobacillus stearothermophilus]